MVDKQLTEYNSKQNDHIKKVAKELDFLTKV